MFRLVWGHFLTVFALYSTAPCPVCRTEGLHHVDSQRCHWSLPHVMRGSWLLSQQRPAGLVRQLHPYMHLRGREHSHDATDCTVTCHTEIWPHCHTSPGHFNLQELAIHKIYLNPPPFFFFLVTHTRDRDKIQTHSAMHPLISPTLPQLQEPHPHSYHSKKKHTCHLSFSDSCVGISYQWYCKGQISEPVVCLFKEYCL